MTIDEIIQGLTGEHFYLNHEHIRHNAIKAAVVILKDYERIQKEYTPTTKNDLGVDAISRADAIRVASGYCHPSNVAKELAKLPSVAPQEPQTFKWCTDCKEYDREKHCCHRWSKVIRDTVAEMKQEYIEREVLDKIRVDIECLETYYDNDYFSGNKDAMFKRSEVLDILDKYKAETEG